MDKETAPAVTLIAGRAEPAAFGRGVAKPGVGGSGSPQRFLLTFGRAVEAMHESSLPPQASPCPAEAETVNAGLAMR